MLATTTVMLPTIHNMNNLYNMEWASEKIVSNVSIFSSKSQETASMSLSFPVDATLKDGSPVQLVLEDEQGVEPLRRLYRVIVDEGMSHPHDRFPDQDDFMDYWFRGLFLSAIADRMVDKHWVFQ
jgi:hypothetical protein